MPTKNKSDMTRLIALCAILSATSIVLGFIEQSFFMAPRFSVLRLGIANIVVLIAIYKLKMPWSFFVLFVKIFAVGFLFGSGISLLYSALGGILSFVIMMIFKKTNCFSIIGVSVIGAFTHSVSQTVLAAILSGTSAILLGIPAVTIVSVISGCFVGFCSKKVCQII